MIRGQSLLSLFVVAACAAMLGGCAANPDDGTESDHVTDALTDPATSADSEPSDEATAEPASSPLDPGAQPSVRTIANKDSRGWAAGEPHPIPWHEAATTSPGSSDESSEPDGEQAPIPPNTDQY